MKKTQIHVVEILAYANTNDILDAISEVVSAAGGHFDADTWSVYDFANACAKNKIKIQLSYSTENPREE